MKVFQSLNCVVCKLPFARKANEDRSPRHLYCGLAMCHECWNKERLLEEEDRKHQCGQKECISHANFAVYLFDVLSQENSLKLSPSGDGYLLAEPFNVPKCMMCHDEYSKKIEQKKSRVLACNHIICMGCFMKNRKPNYGPWKEVYPYKHFCPSCNRETIVSAEQKNRFQDFLDELPEITHQMREMKGNRVCDGCEDTDNIEKMYKIQNVLDELPEITHQMREMKGNRVCDGCEDTGSIDKMYYCIDCTSKICAVCAFENHRSHETTRLFKKETRGVFDILQKDSTNVVKTYKDLFPGMYEGIMGDISNFETKLALKEENDGRDVLKFEDFERKLEECMELKTDFEAFSEELLSDLRRYETRVKGLIGTLDKGPQLKCLQRAGRN